MNSSTLRAKFFYADSPASQRQPSQTDAELLQALKEHADPALRLVIDRHGSAVVGLARKVLGDESLAQDVAEAVFVRLWKTPERFDSNRGTLRTLLLVQTHGLSVDAIRNRAARQSREDRVASARRIAPSPIETDTLKRTEVSEIRAAFVSLPSAERRSIELAYYGGYPYREIAGILGLPEGTVKTQIRSCLGRMMVAIAGVVVA